MDFLDPPAKYRKDDENQGLWCGVWNGFGDGAECPHCSFHLNSVCEGVKYQLKLLIYGIELIQSSALLKPHKKYEKWINSAVTQVCFTTHKLFRSILGMIKHKNLSSLSWGSAREGKRGCGVSQEQICLCPRVAVQKDRAEWAPAARRDGQAAHAATTFWNQRI